MLPLSVAVANIGNRVPIHIKESFLIENVTGEGEHTSVYIQLFMYIYNIYMYISIFYTFFGYMLNHPPEIKYTNIHTCIHTCGCTCTHSSPAAQLLPYQARRPTTR